MYTRQLLRTIVVSLFLLPAITEAGVILVPGKYSKDKFTADKETKGPFYSISYSGLTANVSPTVIHGGMADVKACFASVKIQETIVGPEKPVDAVCIIPLPYGAENRRATVGQSSPGSEHSTPLNAQFLPAAEAQKLYEAVAKGTDAVKILALSGRPALVVPEFHLQGKVDVTVEYGQRVHEQGGLYRLDCPMPMSGFARGPVDRLSVNVSLEADAPLRAVFCPTHTTTVDRSGLYKATVRAKCDAYDGSDDLRLLWVADKDDLGLRVLACQPDADEDGYFMLVGNPTGSATERVTEKDVTFVLDSSGSMRGEKIEQARAAIDYCLGQLNVGDRFNIITFGTDVASFRNAPVACTPAERSAARDFVDSVVAKGETNIDGALAKALAADSPLSPRERARVRAEDVGKTARPRIVIFLTDGAPSVGEMVPETIVANARRENTSGARIFVFGLGHDVNAHLLDRLAEATEGSSEYVVPGEEIDAKVACLYDRLAHPVLTECELAFGDLKTHSVYPQKLPALYRGSEVMVFGRYHNGGKHTFRISGKQGDRPVEYVCTADLPSIESSAPRTSDNDFVAPLWAARKIGAVLQEIRLHGPNDELIGEVVRLSKRFGIVTEYTAFIAAGGKEVSKAEALGMARQQMVVANSQHAGQWAVNQARNDMQLQNRNVASQMANGYFDRSGNVVNVDNIRQLGSRVYYLRDGQWVESDEAGKRKTRVVKLGDAEYQSLIRGNRDFAQAQQLGWAVDMNVGNERVVVEKDGKQKDEELRRLNVQPAPENNQQLNIQNNMQNNMRNNIQQFRNQAPVRQIQNQLRQDAPQR